MTKIAYPLRFLAVFAAVASLAFLVWRGTHAEQPLPQQSVRVSRAPALDPLRIALTPHPGDTALDREIRELQAKVEGASNRNAFLERLGWAFVAKARLSSDPGFYTLAEEAAKAIDGDAPDDPAALLLFGHIYDAEHRFIEAEKIARRLIAQREFVFDYALLGDALMEQGKLAEAVEAYQKMVDLKPCLQTYCRVAHMRWLKGDLPGAIAATRLAVSAGNTREPEPTAWAYTRLALYQLQTGQVQAATSSTASALQFAPGYAPALLMRGRLLLAEEKAGEAIAPLRQAAEISPLPEFLWTLSEALRADGGSTEAEQIEEHLLATGATADPRTFALFLVSHGQGIDRALQLAMAELDSRQDIFTHDAVAWAQFASGHVREAQESIRLALAEGTQDARLLYHAGTIADAAGNPAEALEFFNKAHAFQQMLLPSERKALGQRTTALIAAQGQVSSVNNNP